MVQLRPTRSGGLVRPFSPTPFSCSDLGKSVAKIPEWKSSFGIPSMEHRTEERERETLRTSKRERLSLILDDEPTSLLTRCWRGCSGNVSSSDAKRRLWEKCQRSSPRIFSLCNHRGRLFLVDARCPWCHQARGEVGKSLPESELT